MAKTLVVSPSWIGDAVLSHPLLVRLKARDPQGTIDVLAPPWALPVYRRMPEVAHCHAFPFGHGELGLMGRRRFAKALPAYDHAIVLPNSLKSALVPWFAGIPRRTGYRGEMRYGLLNDVRRLDEAALPLIAERYAALVQPADEAFERPLPEPRLTVDAAARAATVARYKLRTDRPVAVLAPGAEYGPAKRWPPRHFAALALRLLADGFQVWLLGSAKDAPITAAVAHLVHPGTDPKPGTDPDRQEEGPSLVDLAGRTSLDEAIDLMSLAAQVITNDSGLMHVAAALDRPMAALFGSSSPAFTPPLSRRAKVVTLKLACSPCFQRTCPLGHTDCLEKLEPERVLEALATETSTMRPGPTAEPHSSPP